MNFELEYTPAQQQFREEVRGYLEQHVAPVLRATEARDGITYEEYQAQRSLGRALGQRGWLLPNAPVQYGGGGLSFDHTVVLLEELEHGGGGTIRSDQMLDMLVDHVQTHELDGVPIADDPEARGHLADYFIQSEVHRLFGMRNYYLANAKKPRSYEGAQLNQE